MKRFKRYTKLREVLNPNYVRNFLVLLKNLDSLIQQLKHFGISASEVNNKSGCGALETA